MSSWVNFFTEAATSIGIDLVSKKLNKSGSNTVSPTVISSPSQNVDVSPEINSINIIDTGPIADALGERDQQLTGQSDQVGADANNARDDMIDMVRTAGAFASLIFVISNMKGV